MCVLVAFTIYCIIIFLKGEKCTFPRVALGLQIVSPNVKFLLMPTKHMPPPSLITCQLALQLSWPDSSHISFRQPLHSFCSSLYLTSVCSTFLPVSNPQNLPILTSLYSSAASFQQKRSPNSWPKHMGDCSVPQR